MEGAIFICRFGGIRPWISLGGGTLFCLLRCTSSVVTTGNHLHGLPGFSVVASWLAVSWPWQWRLPSGESSFLNHQAVSSWLTRQWLHYNTTFKVVPESSTYSVFPWPSWPNDFVSHFILPSFCWVDSVVCNRIPIHILSAISLCMSIFLFSKLHVFLMVNHHQDN